MALVSSSFPGRVRLRSSILKDKDIADKLIAAVKELGFDGNFSYSALTGSILVEYDPSLINESVINKLKPLEKSVRELRPTILFYTNKDKDYLLSQIDSLKCKAMELLK